MGSGTGGKEKNFTRGFSSNRVSILVARDAEMTGYPDEGDVTSDGSQFKEEFLILKITVTK